MQNSSYASSQSHSFDINVAAKYGVHEAIIIHHFQHWIRINKKLKRNFIDGRTWSYQTIDEICAHFPYLTKEEVREILHRLCNGKARRTKLENHYAPVLIKGNFNKTPFDRTTWYAFADEAFFLNNSYERATAQIERADDQMEPDKSPNPIEKPPTSIPYSNPDSFPDAKEILPPTSFLSEGMDGRMDFSWLKNDELWKDLDISSEDKITLLKRFSELNIPKDRIRSALTRFVILDKSKIPKPVGYILKLCKDTTIPSRENMDANSDIALKVWERCKTVIRRNANYIFKQVGDYLCIGDERGQSEAYIYENPTVFGHTIESNMRKYGYWLPEC